MREILQKLKGVMLAVLIIIGSFFAAFFLLLIMLASAPAFWLAVIAISVLIYLY